MRPKDFYLMFQQLDDKFVALDRTNILITWDMLNGAEISRQKCITDFKDYEVYNPNMGKDL